MTYLHWMRYVIRGFVFTYLKDPSSRPNIPLSATHRDRIPDLNTHTTYTPPHPQRGTPYHRYVSLCLPQPPASGALDYTLNTAARSSPDQVTSAYLDIPVVSNAERKGFDVHAFMQKWGLDGSKGGGAHMFREIWDEDVSRIYKNVLGESLTVFTWGAEGVHLSIGEEEPHYGRPRKPDPYAKLKHSKRYV
jgi:large subunit ribosomal protein L35